MFQQALNSPDTLVAMSLKVVSEEATKFNENGKQYKYMVLNDGQFQMKVKVFQGNGQLPPDGQSGQVLNFNVKAREYKGKYYYSGFWNSESQAVATGLNQPAPAQAPAPAPQQPNVPQPAQPAGQRETETQKGKREYEAKEKAKVESICRQCAGKAAARILGGMDMSGDTEEVTLALFAALAIPMSEWFIHGKWPNVPMDEIDTALGQQPPQDTTDYSKPQQGDEDIPF